VQLLGNKPFEKISYAANKTSQATGADCEGWSTFPANEKPT